MSAEAKIALTKAVVYLVLVMTPLLVFAPKQLLWTVICIGWVVACAYAADRIVESAKRKSE